MADEQPVAWMYSRNTAKSICATQRGKNTYLAADGWTETPLYTRPSTPPAVSDDLVEEIAEILFEKSDEEFPVQHAEYLARAILPIIHRREQQAAEAMKERCAAYVEGAGGVIPGAAVFAGLVSGNNQPCMSGDMRDRINPHTRRRFDDATRDLATAIRSLTTEVGEGKGAQ